MATTANDLISKVKSKTLLPTSQDTLSEEDILARANEEYEQYLIPLLKRYNQAYLEVEENIAVTAGNDLYKIPTRALGGTFTGLTLVDATNTRHDLKRIERFEREIYSNSSVPVYYIQGSSIRLVPEPTTDATLEIGYVRRPNTLVLESASRRVTSVDATTNIVTLNSTASWLSSTAAFDIINTLYPADLVEIDLAASSISNATIQFADVSNIEVGHILAAAGTSPYIAVPQELVPLLVERVVLRVWQALGDSEAMQASMLTINEMQKSMSLLVDNRAKQDPTIIVAHNSPGRSIRRR